MYSWKDLIKTTIIFLGMMAFLAGFLTLNGLHYAGVL